MKYYESRSSKFVGSAGFYIIIACCLIAIGAVSWFAVSRYNRDVTVPPSDVSSVKPENPSRSGNGISSDDNIVPETSSVMPSESVAETVSDVPYESKAPAAELFAPPVEGNISKGYSETELQQSATYGDMRLHTGVDIVCESGAEVKSAGDGTVKSVEDSPTLGTVVTIDHGNGITVKYCGVGGVTVKAGDELTLGTVIGNVSSVPSECSDQSHIHIEVMKDGKITSPLKALGLQ